MNSRDELRPNAAQERHRFRAHLVESSSRSAAWWFKFRRQRPIGPYIDFVCLSEKVIVELDGSQHVTESEYDSRRDAVLRSNGFRVLRFWNGDVMRQLDVVLETIHEALYREKMDGRFD
jgi:very-short-patch-repair endonuclease